ncbi:MAG: putative periplasmic protein [Proteobacteria bacterium]|nr:putative periplasmic protein [Pseudomonadota bacterium]
MKSKPKLSSILIKSCLLASTALSFSFAAPTEQPCPDEVKNLPSGTTCWSGQDEAGAYYWVAKPKEWNGNLVLHSHGGPALGKLPKAERAIEDFDRWSIWVRSGNALAVTSYRQGGVALMSAAEDTARLLPIASKLVGKTKKVILHGQSWGGGVAARAAEVGGPLSKVQPKIDAVLLTSGVLAGGTKSYDFRLDLRVVWQAMCENHPRANEMQYPLWQGLASKDAKMSKEDLTQRVNECLGLNKPEAERSEKQKENLKTIVNVIKIPEKSIQGHLGWATNHFQDIVFNRLNGRNPFGNDTIKYVGSSNDEELNKKVLRYKADPSAVADFGKDTDPTGNIALPMITMRGINDSIAFVELASTWEENVAKAGRSKNLVQLYTNDKEHSYLSDAQYVAAMSTLLTWVDTGKKPTPQDVVQKCSALDAKWNPQSDCRILPEYKPAPLSSRVPAR